MQNFIPLNKVNRNETLFEYSQRLISQADAAFTRYSYDHINWKNRLVGLVGPSWCWENVFGFTIHQTQS